MTRSPQRVVATPSDDPWPTGPIRRVRVAWLLVALASAFGCNSGGGGGTSGGSGATPTASIESVVVTPSLAGTTIDFLLKSPLDNPVDVQVRFSQNRGLSYSDADLIGDPGSALDAVRDGTAFRLVWSPLDDLEDLDQSDLRIRLTPVDTVTGVAGNPATSEVFGLGNNTAPSIHSVNTPAGTVGGDVELSFDVSDPEADAVAVLLDYSVDSGATWTSGTVRSDSETVTTTVAPVTRTVYWDAQVDVPGLTSATVRVRLTPLDLLEGTSADTLDFTVDLRAPSVTLVTVGEITSQMNGSTTYAGDASTVDFDLSVPRFGFRLTIDYAAAAGGNPLDLASLSVVCDQTLGTTPAGSDLGGNFTTGAASAAWDVPAAYALPLGTATFTATIDDTLGNTSTAASIRVKAVSGDSGYRPFSFTDRWWINFNTDYFTIGYTGGATVTVTSTAGANGISDFQEDLSILGLQATTPTAAAATLGTNSILLTWAKNETVGRLNQLFGRNFDGSGAGYNDGIQFQLSSSGATSQIRVGGDDVVSGFTLGRAQFDHRNSGGNTNSSTDLGVFLTNMIEFYINSSFTFQDRFNALVPGRGTPAGEGALDHIVLDPSFDRLDAANTAAENSRYDDIYDAIDAVARATAVVIAHEIGHSIGLCANDPPPSGLFGGESDAPFSGFYTTPYHFDSPGNNLMAAALSFSTSLISTSSGYQFNELNQAYLAEWTLLQP